MVSESEYIYTFTHLRNLAVSLSQTLSSPGNHPCFSCKTVGHEVTRCSVSGCGCFYHEDCVRKLLGTTSSPGGGFCCPQHICSTCCLERDLQRASKGEGFSALFDVVSLDSDSCWSTARPIKESEIMEIKRIIKLHNVHPSFGLHTGRLMRCIRCPVAYHTGDSCVAAGSVILTHHIMICSSHGSTKRNGLLTSPVNVSWCFLCARGKPLNVVLLIAFPSCSPIISLAP